MKKFLFSFVGLMLLAQGANATSLHPHTFSVLKLEVAPILENHHLPAGGQNEVVTVHPNGDVMYRKTQFFKPTVKLVKQLNAYQMDRIVRLVEEAKEGAMVSPKIFCLAIPTESRIYTAENGSMVLRSGSEPCGASLFNNSKAAGKLTELLNKYLYEARSLAK